MPDYLLPIAEREPLLWIVRERRTAFAEHRAAEAARLERSDRLFLYTTRGCFRNPTRDRVELAPLVQKFAGMFPDPCSWSVRMRRALVPLAPPDADVIARLLAGVVRPYEEARGTYGALPSGGRV